MGGTTTPFKPSLNTSGNAYCTTAEKPSMVGANDLARTLKALYVDTEDPNWIYIKLDVGGLYPGVFNTSIHYDPISGVGPSKPYFNYGCQYSNITNYLFAMSVSSAPSPDQVSQGRVVLPWYTCVGVQYVAPMPINWFFFVGGPGYVGGNSNMQHPAIAAYTTPNGGGYGDTEWTALEAYGSGYRSAVSYSTGSVMLALNRTLIQQTLGTLGTVNMFVCSYKPGENHESGYQRINPFTWMSPGDEGGLVYDGWSYAANDVNDPLHAAVVAADNNGLLDPMSCSTGYLADWFTQMGSLSAVSWDARAQLGSPAPFSVNLAATATLSVVCDQTGSWNMTNEYTTGKNFTVDINAENVVDFYDYDLAVSWNPAVLNYSAPVNYIKSWFTGTLGAGSEIYSKGNISGIASAYTGSALGATGSGTLFQINFTVLGSVPCSTWISITVTTFVYSPSYTPSPGGNIPYTTSNALFALVKIPPPAVPGSAALTESAAPYYVGYPISFSGAGSTAGSNGTVTVPLMTATLTIINCSNLATVYTNTIKNSSASAYTWIWTPSAAGTYNATLTVTLNSTGIHPVRIPLLYTDGPYTKIVYLKAATFIDCWTAAPRWSGYTAASVGIGQNAAADAYTFDENVTIYSIVVYNNQPMAGYLVSFTVVAPTYSFNNPLLMRTAYTNASGIANITFRIPTEGVGVNSLAGKWECFQKVYMCQEPYTDTLWWDVGYIVQVTSVSVPTVKISQQTGTITVTINYQNIAEAARNVTISVTVYDNNLEPINILESLSVLPGAFCVPKSGTVTYNLTIPTWFKPGQCWVYVDLYNKLPINCGHPWCPEYSTTFMVNALGTNYKY
jgi:hypothetical protein